MGGEFVLKGIGGAGVTAYVGEVGGVGFEIEIR